MHRRAGAALGEYTTDKNDVVYSAVFHYTSIHGTAIERDGGPRDD